MNSWETYLARMFELRLERDLEIQHIRECWLRYGKQTLMLEAIGASDVTTSPQP